MYLSEQLQEKWAPVLDHDGAGKIKDPYRRAVTALVLENQERAMAEERGVLNESITNAAGTGGFSGSSAAAGPVAGYDPILISLVRRALPNLMAYDIAGVQPMTGPTGLIFAMRSRRGTNRSTNETFFDEVLTSFTSQNAAGNLAGVGSHTGSNPVSNTADSTVYTTGKGMSTSQAEALGDSADNGFAEMNFSIEKVTVTARSRALKAEYTMELAQDLKAVHGLDARPIREKRQGSQPSRYAHQCTCPQQPEHVQTCSPNQYCGHAGQQPGSPRLHLQPRPPFCGIQQAHVAWRCAVRECDGGRCQQPTGGQQQGNHHRCQSLFESSDGTPILVVVGPARGGISQY